MPRKPAADPAPIPGTNRLLVLLAEYRELGRAKADAERAQGDLKERIIPLLKAQPNAKLRNDTVSGTVRRQSRETVNPKKLLEAGVRPATIRACTDVTEYDVLDVRDVKAKGESDGE